MFCRGVRTNSKLPKLRVLRIANFDWFSIFQTKITKIQAYFCLIFSRTLKFKATFAKNGQLSGNVWRFGRHFCEEKWSNLWLPQPMMVLKKRKLKTTRRNADEAN